MQVSLKSEKNNECFMWRPNYMYDSISLSFSWNEICFRQSYRENQNTHFVFSNIKKKNRAPFWDNVEKYVRARQTTDDSVMWHRKDAIYMPDN
jgi:hypothetical protein